jgi:hypothetical protein
MDFKQSVSDQTLILNLYLIRVGIEKQITLKYLLFLKNFDDSSR